MLLPKRIDRGKNFTLANFFAAWRFFRYIAVRWFLICSPAHSAVGATSSKSFPLMTNITRSALLPYPAEKVYTLINDVAAYPQFMQGCVGAEVLKQTDDYMEARLDLERSGMRYSLVTRNRLDPPLSINMELVEGPFKSLSGRWQVTALNEVACKVSLELKFVLLNPMMSLAARMMFNPMADNLVDALVKRANYLYQHPG